MTDVTKMFETDSPWMKAADHAGLNKQLLIEDVGLDELNYPGEAPKQIVWVKLEKAPKPIVLSKTNGSVLVGAFGGKMEDWKQKKVLLTTRDYSIDGKNTTGWVITPLLADKSTGFDDDIPF